MVPYPLKCFLSSKRLHEKKLCQIVGKEVLGVGGVPCYKQLGSEKLNSPWGLWAAARSVGSLGGLLSKAENKVEGLIWVVQIGNSVANS